MNERIKELFEQAHIQPPATRSGQFMFTPPKTFSPEKFAELFVAECMEQINKVEKKGDAHLGGGYFYDGTRLCRDAIKQHFGVDNVGP